MDGDNDQCDQADGDDRMHDEHQPMPGRCTRAFDGALECTLGVRAYARRAALLSTLQQLKGVAAQIVQHVCHFPH